MKAKVSVIYNNYDLWNDHAEDARQFLIDEYPEECPDGEPSDDAIWDVIYEDDQITWEDERERLRDFFNGRGFWLVRGVVERWNGKSAGGMVFDDFEKMLYTVGKDCDFFKLWDEGGHFYIRCSHHDGTNIFEVKRLSPAGYRFIDNWSYNWQDPRTEAQIHDIVWKSNFLSALPHYAREVFGV